MLSHFNDREKTFLKPLSSLLAHAYSMHRISVNRLPTESHSMYLPNVAVAMANGSVTFSPILFSVRSLTFQFLSSHVGDVRR